MSDEVLRLLNDKNEDDQTSLILPNTNQIDCYVSTVLEHYFYIDFIYCFHHMKDCLLLKQMVV